MIDQTPVRQTYLYKYSFADRRKITLDDVFLLCENRPDVPLCASR